jgi:hypothetical protein
MTWRLAVVPVDARDLCPACLPRYVGVAEGVMEPGRGCLQPHTHTRDGPAVTDPVGPGAEAADSGLSRCGTKNWVKVVARIVRW